MGVGEGSNRCRRALEAAGLLWCVVHKSSPRISSKIVSLLPKTMIQAFRIQDDVSATQEQGFPSTGTAMGHWPSVISEHVVRRSSSWTTWLRLGAALGKVERC